MPTKLMTEREIDIYNQLNIPKECSIIHFRDNIIVIFPLLANWCVLQTENHLKIFEYLKEGLTINELISSNKFLIDEIKFVVTQIVARRICTKSVTPVSRQLNNLHLYLTNKCNLSCPHCYMFSGLPNANELTKTEIFRLIDNFKDIAKGEQVTLSGGEPSIHSDFDSIVKYIYERGLLVKVLTNGTVFNLETFKTIGKFIDSIQISLDGFSEESNSQIRGKGNFHKTLSTIEFALEQGIKTSVAITPSLNELIHNRDKFVTFAQKLLAKHSSENFKVKFAEGLSEGRNVKPTDTDNKIYANIIKSIEYEIYGEDPDLISFVEKLSGDVIMDNCMFGQLTISSNGEAYFCPEISSISSIGNVRTNPFQKIWEECLEVQQNTTSNHLQPCSSCELIYICGGGCRIKEFPSIVQKDNDSLLNCKTFFSRACNTQIKDKFYDLMIKSNEYFYE